MISTQIDHIAVAIPRRELAVRRFLEDLGGGSVASGRRAGSTIDQIRFARNTKLELIGPDADHADRGRMEGFLAKYGSAIHHVTLLVDDVADTVQRLRADGVEPSGVALGDPRYQEAFILPKDAGGVLVQLSWKDVDDEGWARRYGHVPTAPRADCADFIGARIAHPDLNAAAAQWTRLGGTIGPSADGFVVVWGADDLQLRVVNGAPRSVEQLLFADCAPMPGAPEVGPEIVNETRE
jgi:methylmalonyl-CoA/ethylmalonyl-CoA epimerase